MQDRFTKWIEIAPLRKATATNVTKAFTDQVIYRHGCPERLLTDNGTQLKSAQLAKVLQTFGIQHRTTPPYTPQCNPVERANRTIKTMIAQYVGKNQKAWDDHVPALRYAFNTAWNEATGYTPAYLNHGRELARPHPEDRQHQQAAAAPETIERHLGEAHELVRIHLARAFQHQERHYNLRRRNWQPRLAELVWRRNHALSNKADAFNAKLAPKYVGPLEVRRIVSPVIVDLRDRQGRWHRHVHVQELKEHPDQTTNNPDEPRAPPPNNAAVTLALDEGERRHRRNRQRSYHVVK
ncbi:uncharacterized protein K02A2.6-like [Formica exsecta]|uniref:uncharacterized protein K02A2.6-like n=1 Tax=Formica exsecta TaxID=72781 RepID=UPI0011440BDE|nr:uncharacterized protein K02A2.6-like [Formica exsecta]